MAPKSEGASRTQSGAEAPAASAQASQELQLPAIVFGVVEVRRLQRELTALNGYFSQQKLREAGQQPSLPRTSKMLETMASDNHLSLLQEPDRARLDAFLQQLAASAPQLHISFATDPSAAFVAKIVHWLRGNIHALTLVQIGLQPSIAAGCIVRTANKSFDFSLRNRFVEQRAGLIKSIEKAAL